MTAWAALLFFLACASGNHDAAERKVELEGRFAMTGSMPFTKLVFRGDDGTTYEVSAREKAALAPVQEKGHVRIEGLARQVVLKTVDGTRVKTVHLLREVKVSPLKADPAPHAR